MDFRKIKGLQICQTKQIQRVEGGYIVPSQNSNKKYFVDEHEYDCTCPDYKERQCTCKHAYAVRYYLHIEKETSQGTQTEKLSLTHKQAWHAYNQAQNNEVMQFDILLKDLVERIEEPEQRFGRPRLSLKEQIFCSTQKVYSQLSSRRAYSLFKNAQAKEQIEKAPNYNAINKLLNREDITPILHELISLSAFPLKVVEETFAIDSSGFRTTSFNDYCREKHDIKKEHEWVKVHILCGTKTNVICSAEITEENASDCRQFIPLADKASKSGFNIKELCADKAYSSRDNIDFIDDLGGTAYIPFKSNSTGRSRGSLLWHKMFHYFKYRKEDFLAHYHRRSNVESTFNMIKAKFGDKIKSKNKTARVNEMLCKILAHNIVVLIHEFYELGISPDLVFGKKG